MKSYEKLIWDSDFFGFDICRIEVSDYCKSEMQATVSSAFKDGIKLVYLVIPEAIDKKDMFASGFVSSKVIFTANIDTDNRSDNNVREYISVSVTEQMYDLALESGRYSRFKLDVKFPSGSYEKLYGKWIENSVNGTISDKVFVFDRENNILGLVTLKIKEGRVGEIGLIAVDKKYQGTGIGTKLLNYTKDYLMSRDINELEVATQRENKQACTFYLQNGFKIKETFNYYHIWNMHE